MWEHLYETVSSVIPKSQIVVVGVDIMGHTRSESVKIGYREYMRS